MTALDDLISAVEAATGPSREIDAAVFAMFPPSGLQIIDVNRHNGWVLVRWLWKDYPEDLRAPELTASIDAVVALIRRAMPGEEWLTGLHPEIGPFAQVGPAGFIGSRERRMATEALALLLAFLRAYEARQTEDATT